jgi:hypothetical protein
VPYATADARSQILEALGESADDLAVGLAQLGEAYELVDEATAERLEVELFRPLKLAYGRARRAHGAFAERHELATREFALAPEFAPARGAKGLMEDARLSVVEGEQKLAELQDSMLPVEVGDAELRADLEQVRTLLAGFIGHTRELLRTLGR